MKSLEEAVNEFEGYLSSASVLNPKVSSGSVGWHISHSLLTMQVVIDAITNSKPEEYKPDFNWKRLYVFAVNKIPRGKVKAPKSVRPKEDFSAETLKSQLALTREKLRTLDNLSGGHYFTHPFMGRFKLRPAKKFILLHSNHHLKIIKEIKGEG